MMEKLEPCPFCGGCAEMESRGPEWAIVFCPKCLADGPYYPEPDSTQPAEAIELWNKRVAAGLLETLELARSWMIPGMNWTDATGQEILDKVDTAIKRARNKP